MGWVATAANAAQLDEHNGNAQMGSTCCMGRLRASLYLQADTVDDLFNNLVSLKIGILLVARTLFR